MYQIPPCSIPEDRHLRKSQPEDFTSPIALLFYLLVYSSLPSFLVIFYILYHRQISFKNKLQSVHRCFVRLYIREVGNGSYSHRHCSVLHGNVTVCGGVYVPLWTIFGALTENRHKVFCVGGRKHLRSYHFVRDMLMAGSVWACITKASLLQWSETLTFTQTAHKGKMLNHWPSSNSFP